MSLLGRISGWPLECDERDSGRRCGYVASNATAARLHVRRAHPTKPYDFEGLIALKLAPQCPICLDHLPDPITDNEIGLCCCHARFCLYCLSKSLERVLYTVDCICPICRKRLGASAQARIFLALHDQVRARLLAEVEQRTCPLWMVYSMVYSLSNRFGLVFVL